MKILVENVAKIEHAEVAVQGISVLAGHNATGKSTVSKSLNAIISAYTDALGKAENFRLQSKEEVFKNFLESILQDGDPFVVWNPPQPSFWKVFPKKDKVTEYYEYFRMLAPRYLDMDIEEFPESTPEINSEYRRFLAQLWKVQNRPEEEDIKFVVEESILRVFDNQINTIGQDSLGRIALSDDNGTMLCEVAFQGNRLQSCTYKNIKGFNPIYLEPKHCLDGVPIKKTSRSFGLVDLRLPNLMVAGGGYTDWITIEVREKLDRILALINETIHGGLVENGNYLQYMEENSSFLSLKNLASGSKMFVVIKRLLESGWLSKNQTLIIDEPEINLHPEWQVILAKVLVMLCKELGVKILLNSHSPYFIRAVEVCSKRYDIEDRCFFYQTIQGENGLYRVEDVTKATEKIYKALYRPLEEL